LELRFAEHLALILIGPEAVFLPVFISKSGSIDRRQPDWYKVWLLANERIAVESTLHDTALLSASSGLAVPPATTFSTWV